MSVNGGSEYKEGRLGRQERGFKHFKLVGSRLHRCRVHWLLVSIDYTKKFDSFFISLVLQGK